MRQRRERDPYDELPLSKADKVMGTVMLFFATVFGGIITLFQWRPKRHEKKTAVKVTT